MNETVQVEENLDESCKDEGVVALLSVQTVYTDRDSEDKETSTSDDARLTGTALLKSLLSTSTASSVAVAEKMITTTEVTDEKLNLKKILYQPDKEKKDDKDNSTLLANTNDTLNDDDDRLVIDISDEEKDGEARTNGKSMPSLSSSNSRKTLIPQTCVEAAPIKQLTRLISRSQENDLPKSITYSLASSTPSGINSNCFKIDILAPTMNQSDATIEKRVSNYQSIAKCSKMSSLDELNVISHEIDKQITKKTNAILELLKEYLSGTVEKNIFLAKMTDASDTSLTDLISVARKLTKRHKFEPNPNHKEFMRIKFLQFPTTSKDLVIYFDNLLPSLNKDKFISMIKFYEIIIKEMLNLNKTKILQYLIDFMVVRKNVQLDLLNYNYQVTSAPNLKHANSSSTKFQLADSTQNFNERKSIKLQDTSYNFIIRSDPIYLQAGSSFVTNHRDVISCRISSRIQTRNFERRPFDNNILKGRRIGRRLVRSPEDEKSQEFLRSRFPLTPQSEPGTPVHPLTLPRCLTPIIVESDTPPPSLHSDPPSPPTHKVMKLTSRSSMIVQPVKAPEQVNEEARNAARQVQVNPLKRRATEMSINISSEQLAKDPLQNGQITIHEIQTLNQNGTEIIPTSILKNTIMNRRKTTEQDRVQVATTESEMEVLKSFIPRTISHEEPVKSSSNDLKPTPKRRQSCHERIMMPVSESEEKTIENSTIGRNYMDFLHEYEKAEKAMMKSNKPENNQHPEIQQRPQKMNYFNNNPQPLHNTPKRVRFSEVDEEAPRSPRNYHQQQPQVNYSQHQQMETRQRFPQLQFLQGSPMRSPIKSHPPPINYQFYQNQFERELRERGFDHRAENHQEPNRPLELVSHIPPERYHQHEQQRAHYAKQMRQESPRSQPRNPQYHVDAQHAAMMAAAYQQLQSLHRDPTTLSPQQYAEHLKQLDHLKHLQPSAFTAFSAFHRQPPQEQRVPPSDYYTNTHEVSEKVIQSPHHYQISSSSSREDSPNNYEMMKQDESLQRKMKNKAKSSTYIEPNQLTKPFFNPAHSTYYSEPFALVKPKQVPATSPKETATAFHPPPDAQRPRSPVPRNFIDPNVNPSQYQWFVAKAHAQNHLQNHNQPQRPIPRPPVPTFIAKSNGTSQHRPILFQEPPTEFLRNYYASQQQKYES